VPWILVSEVSKRSIHADTFIVLTIAAMLSSKPLFTGPMEKREEIKK
jgi:hypothetical protein